MNDEFMKLANDAITNLQAENIVQTWVLQSILSDLANTFEDPDVYLSKMHERLSAGADAMDLSKPEVAGGVRFYVDAIITHARKNSKAGKGK